MRIFQPWNWKVDEISEAASINLRKAVLAQVERNVGRYAVVRGGTETQRGREEGTSLGNVGGEGEVGYARSDNR